MRRSSTSSSERELVIEAPSEVEPRSSVGALVRWSLIAFVVLVLVGELVARGLQPLPPDRTWPDAEAQAKADHAAAVRDRGQTEDVVFAGSSIADAAFDPAVVLAPLDGATGFSYAQEGSAAATMSDFVEAVVLPQVDPEVLVIGLTGNELNDGGQRQRELEELQRASRGYRLAAGTPTVVDRAVEQLNDRSALFAHRETLRDPYAAWRDRGLAARWLENDPETGALLRHRDLTYEAPIGAASEEVWGDFAVGGHQLDALRRLLRTADAAGVEVVLVELPVFLPGFEEQLEEAGSVLEETHRAIATLAEEACVGVVDLRSVAQDERFWADPEHVNAAGTRAVSEALGVALAEREPPSC